MAITKKPAAKKPAAKVAKKPETKAAKAKQSVNYREMPAIELEEALAGKRAELVTLTRSHKAGELVNPRVLGQARRDIARIHTAIAAHKTKSEDK